MSMPPLMGHAQARQRLAAAHAAGRLPQVLLLEGPEGVGRQRVGLWLGQLLLCPAPSGGEPCGSCRSCRMVLGLAHPDLHWFVPIPRPKAGDPDKQVDEAAETIGAVLAERRQEPLYGAPDGMASHGIASIRLLQRRASLTSVEGGARVFLVGHAERMVPQESSPEAANAALKLLEEPPVGTWFILTTSDAKRLLPTIRSRVVPLRLERLAVEEVEAFLRAYQQPTPSPNEARQRALAAEGCIGAAISATGAGAKAAQAATDLLAAALGGGTALAERALKQQAFAARGDFSAMLDALEVALAEAACAAAGGTPRGAVAKPLARRPLEGLLAAQRHVAAAKESAAGNVNPQLITAVLGDQLARCL